MSTVKEYGTFVETLQCHLSHDISKWDPNDIYTTCKALRDFGIETQQFEDDSEFIIDSVCCTVEIINKILDNYTTDRFSKALGQALQFLHNLTVQNKKNQLLIWNKCRSHLNKWIELSNEKRRNYICGILYNIILGHPEFLEYMLQDTVLTDHIFQSTMKGTDFAIILTEEIKLQLSEDPNHIMDSYLKSSTVYHIEMLNTLYECVQNKEADTRLVNWVAKKFKERAEQFTQSAISETELQEFFVLLKILLVISGKDRTNTILQNDSALLEISLQALEWTHLQGKSSKNEFTPTENIMTERTAVENFKSNTIRLIGNLCWRNKIGQDKVREMGIIPIVLDCSIRDGKNPFITESVVFTVRNLCEENMDNQKLIENLNKLK